MLVKYSVYAGFYLLYTMDFPAEKCLCFCWLRISQITFSVHVFASTFSFHFRTLQVYDIRAQYYETVPANDPTQVEDGEGGVSVGKTKTWLCFFGFCCCVRADLNLKCVWFRHFSCAQRVKLNILFLFCLFRWDRSSCISGRSTSQRNRLFGYLWTKWTGEQRQHPNATQLQVVLRDLLIDTLYYLPYFCLYCSLWDQLLYFLDNYF